MMMPYFIPAILLLVSLKSHGDARYLLIELDGDYSVKNPGPNGSTKYIAFFEHVSEQIS